MTAAQRFDPTPRRRVGPGPSPRASWRVVSARSVGLTVVLLVAESLALRRADLTLRDLGWAFPVAMVLLVVASEMTIAAFRRSLSECAA